MRCSERRRKMVTYAGDGARTNPEMGWDLRGLSADEKPTELPNGSTFLEMDTGDVYIFDEEHYQWRKL